MAFMESQSPVDAYLLEERSVCYIVHEDKRINIQLHPGISVRGGDRVP